MRSWATTESLEGYFPLKVGNEVGTLLKPGRIYRCKALIKATLQAIRLIEWLKT
jgi:hypothetical protein